MKISLQSSEQNLKLSIYILIVLKSVSPRKAVVVMDNLKPFGAVCSIIREVGVTCLSSGNANTAVLSRLESKLDVILCSEVTMTSGRVETFTKILCTLWSFKDDISTDFVSDNFTRIIRV